MKNNKETYFVIARGGYLKQPEVSRLVISSEDEEAEEFGTFDEYVDYVLEQECGEYEQKFASTICIKESELPQILKKIQKLQK